MYNGHKNYNAWNISLWLGNDESLYRLMRRCIIGNRRPEAAEEMLRQLRDMGITETPDGVKYTKTNIRLAMEGIKP